jgi:hypothetical protein
VDQHIHTLKKLNRTEEFHHLLIFILIGTNVGVLSPGTFRIWAHQEKLLIPKLDFLFEHEGK